jgi:hypothetical protein
MSIVNQRSIVENLTFYDRENLIWDCDCTPEEKIVLLALNLDVDVNGVCETELQVIQDRCGLTKIDRIINSLIHNDLIAQDDCFQILFETLKNEVKS